MKNEAIYLAIDPGSGVNLGLNGKEIVDADENRRGKRYRQNKNCNKKSRGGKTSPTKNDDPSDSDGSSSNHEYNDKPDQKKFQSHRRKTENRGRASRRNTNSNPDGFSRDSSAALLERSTNRVVVIVPTRLMKKVASEDDRASYG